MKTSEELKIHKAEMEALNGKLAQLSAEELKQVTPGADMYEPQQITMTVQTLKGYLDRFGLR